MVTNGVRTPPRWDMSGLYPSLASRELQAAHEGVIAGVGRLASLYDQHDVRAGPMLETDATAVSAAEEVIAATNELHEELRRVSAFLHAFVTTDATDTEAAALQSALQMRTTRLRTLSRRFDAWAARFDTSALADASIVVADHLFPLQRAAQGADRQMPEGQESLAADLATSGAAAWAKLHRDTSARLTAVVDTGTGPETLSMSRVRNLAFASDAATRRAAFGAELAAWESVSVPLAAALNSAKGHVNVLNQRRGWDDALEPALFTNNVDRATLDAMHEAVRASFPDFRRYLRARATLLGHDGGLPWWDLFAPVDAEAPRFDWSEATERVRRAFARYSPALASIVGRFVDNRWMDAEPRDGKATGAFCMSVQDDESRVFLNFDGSFNSVQTLAHELGHAYHNVNLAGRTPLQRRTPMALAETASIFCETVMVQAGLASADERERLTILDTDLQGSTQVVVDIHSRFLFEWELCRRREDRELSVDELCRLMTESQSATYGDGLDLDHLHPYMWAVKGHYFTPFYNWPYCFGLLFGLGLYARFEEDPDRFRSGYDDLLSSTGLGDAATLARRFGIDIADTAFWSASLDVVRDRIDDFCHVAAAR